MARFFSALTAGVAAISSLDVRRLEVGGKKARDKSMRSDIDAIIREANTGGAELEFAWDRR